jgi:hypothetical protein
MSAGEARAGGRRRPAVQLAKELSSLIAAIDHAQADEDGAGAQAAVARVRELLDHRTPERRSARATCAPCRIIRTSSWPTATSAVRSPAERG